ncbi:uncharacterized protein LOC118196870 isoform X2 [Stegodyphus dumicola]|uniref:uncharacterized protein LOC118196870 isoform X2 n=1 Tax=Stegodyphus dumicola TaxID=202533 RepID=UPI0015B0E537|nr:uncharacterized protein LOC118196870 isoform X2 [Stegodyphus dumicola]
MESCAIPSCVNYNRLVTDVGLYPLPEDRNARILWMQAFCLKEIKNPSKFKEIKVCGEHFWSRRSNSNVGGPLSGPQLGMPTNPSQKTNALVKQVKSRLPPNYAVRVVGVFSAPVNKNTPSPQGTDLIQSAPNIISVNSEVSEQRSAATSRNNTVVSGITVSGCTLKSPNVLSTVSNTSECAYSADIFNSDKVIHNVSSNVGKSLCDIDLDLECEEEDLSAAQESALNQEWLGWLSANKSLSESSAENESKLSVKNFSEPVAENLSKSDSTIEGSYEFITENNESVLPGSAQSGLPFGNSIKLPDVIPLSCIPAVNPVLSGTVPYKEPLLNPSTFVASSANVVSAPTFVTPASNILLLAAQNALIQPTVPPHGSAPTILSSAPTILGSAPTILGSAINNTELANYPKMSKFPVNESIVPNLEIDEENSRGTPNADLSKVVVVYETSDGPTDSPLVKENSDTSEVSAVEESNIAEDPECEEILPSLSSTTEGSDVGRKRSCENDENEEPLRKLQKVLTKTYSKSQMSSVQSQESRTYSKFNTTSFEAQTPSFLSTGQHMAFPTRNSEGFSERQNENEILPSDLRTQVSSTLAVNVPQMSTLTQFGLKTPELPQMSSNQSNIAHTQKGTDGPVILSVIGSAEDASREDEIQKVLQEDSPGVETSCGLRTSTAVLSLNYLRGIAAPNSIFSMQINIPVIPAGDQYFNTRNLLNIKCYGINLRQKYFNELKSRLRKTDFVTSSLSWLLEKNYLPKNPPCNLCGGKVFTLTKDKRFFDGFCWLCDSCSCAEPVKRPKFFQQFLFLSVEELLLLTFHWACQSDLDTILEDIDLDLSKIWSYFKALQKLCKYVVAGKKLGFPTQNYKQDNKIEVSVVKLGNFFILGVHDRGTKITGLEVINVDEACCTDRHLHLIRQGICPDSIIITEKRIESSFLPEARSTWSADSRIMDPNDIRNHILNVKTYLWTNMKAMFGKFRHEELDRTTIQGFLSELQWREIFGKCADSAFWCIMDQMNAFDVSADSSEVKNMKDQLSQHLKAHWGGASKEDSYDTTMKIGDFSKELNPRLSKRWSQGRDGSLIELRQKISEVDQNLKNIQSKKEVRRSASATNTDETCKEINSNRSNSGGLKCMYPSEMKTYAKANIASKLSTKIYVKVPFQLVPDKRIEFVKKLDSEFQNWPSFGNPSIEVLQKTLPRMPRVYVRDPSKSYTSQDHEALYLEIRLRKECFTSSPVRWLVKKGFVKNRIPCDKCKADLVLKDNPSYKDGSAWICQKSMCHFQKEFTRPTFYAKFDYPISSISLLIYHWACQSDMRTVMSEVPLPLYQILSVWQSLREVCSANMKERFVKFGGEKEIIEVAVVQYENILIIGAMQRKTKAVYMGAVPKQFKDKINPFINLLPSWVLPKSIIVVKSYYSMGGMYTVVSADRNIIDADNHGYHILNVTQYLEKTVKYMLGHIKGTLYSDMIQVHLNELMWRERFGKTPQTAFANIIKEISALDQKDPSSVFLDSESLPWALRTGVVCIAPAYVHVNKLSNDAIKRYTGLSIREFLSSAKKNSVIPSVKDKSIKKNLQEDNMNLAPLPEVLKPSLPEIESSLPEVQVVLEKLDPEYVKKIVTISSGNSMMILFLFFLVYITFNIR